MLLQDKPQLIVGATMDHDLKILHLSESLYKRFSKKGILFSICSRHPSSQPSHHCQSSLLREHRLYQADWLLRFYGFTAGELLDEKHPNLDTELIQNHPGLFETLIFSG